MRRPAACVLRRPAAVDAGPAEALAPPAADALLAQTDAPAAVAPPEVMQPAHLAIRDEGWSEVISLGTDVKRKHIMWTHIQTTDPRHRQPESFSRLEFWQHILRCYKAVYPEAANKTESIVLFGIVVKELHAESREDSLRHQHHHAAVYCSRQHMWNRVAKFSLERCCVKMHASCHEGYASMYSYVKAQSVRKPLSELDDDAYLSEDHPRGDLLKRLLEAGAKSAQGYSGRADKRAAASSTDVVPKRTRVADLYALARETGITTASALQAHAQSLANGGDATLAEFCTVQGTDRLQDGLDAAWAVLTADSSRPAVLDRVNKLRHAAESQQCICGGLWPHAAAQILVANGHDVGVFARAVVQALVVGARRGSNVAIVGAPGCGKSLLVEALRRIFAAMPAPQAGSTFPLTDLPSAEILLWQDVDAATLPITWSDLLKLLVGEAIGIRMPGSKNLAYSNTAPCFYTAHDQLRWPGDPSSPQRARNDAAIAERFQIFHFTEPVPTDPPRILNFPHCPRCCANFYLNASRNADEPHGDTVDTDPYFQD